MDQYIGKFLDDRYEILDVLGTGGMAVVYKAKCHRLNRMVAIKILKPELAQDEEIRNRFHDESQAVAKLNHPNIVNVFDVNQSDGVEYIVMELIEGITLKQYMRKRGSSLNWREALHFMSQILQALRHAHSRGIIHRDIKPQNIMVLRDGSVKVADFGIARITDSQRTMTQEALGSVHYISPEQARGSNIDARSDLYSAGVVLYEMLTGALPYNGDSPVAVVLQHVQSIPTPPRAINPDIPLGMEQITKKAMAPNPDRRYPSADAMLADLDAFRKNPDIDFGYSDPWVLERQIDEDEPTQIHPAVQLDPEAIQRKREEQAAKKKAEGADAAAAAGAGGAQQTPPVTPTPQQPEPEEDGSDDNYEVEEDGKDGKRTAVMIGAVVAIILLVCLIFVLLWNMIFSGIFSDGSTYEVPNLLGKTYQEAIATIADDPDLNSHFTVTVSEETAYSADYEPGQIIKQDPEGGTSTKSETTDITVTLCAEDDDKVEVKYMPNIVGKNYRDWSQTLYNDYNVIVSYKFEYSDEYEKNLIISTDPKSGDELTEGQKVTLYISKGQEEKLVTMVTVTGMSQSEAEKTIQGLGLTVGSVVDVDSDEAKGTVIFQSVKNGAEVKPGTKVNLQVSKGPQEDPTPVDPDHPTDPDTPDHPDNPDTPDDPNEDNTSHQIKVTLPDDREEASAVVIKINGSILYSKSVAPDKSIVSVSYVGKIESSEITVDGEPYDDYTIS